jgi:hypothetical protein
MNMEKIMESWSIDCKYDETELARESLNTPVLHNKYYKILMGERAVLFRLKSKVKQTKRMLMEYYSGDLNDPETLNDINREVWAKRVLKSDLDTYIDSDSEMIQELLKLALQEEKVDYLISIIDRIKQRGWEVRNAIEWNKFTQ